MQIREVPIEKLDFSFISDKADLLLKTHTMFLVVAYDVES